MKLLSTILSIALMSNSVFAQKTSEETAIAVSEFCESRGFFSQETCVREVQKNECLNDNELKQKYDELKARYERLCSVDDNNEPNLSEREVLAISIAASAVIFAVGLFFITSCPSNNRNRTF